MDGSYDWNLALSKKRFIWVLCSESAFRNRQCNRAHLNRKTMNYSKNFLYFYCRRNLNLFRIASSMFNHSLQKKLILAAIAFTSFSRRKFIRRIASKRQSRSFINFFGYWSCCSWYWSESFIFSAIEMKWQPTCWSNECSNTFKCFAFNFR